MTVPHKHRQIVDEDNNMIPWVALFNAIGFNPDTPNFDAFNRLRVSNPFTVYDIKQNTSNQPLFYDDAEISGSGTTSTYNDNKASTTIAVAANTAGHRVRQTKTWAQYQPGKSQLIITSFNFRGAVPGVTKRAGMFNERFGFFVQVTGDGIACGVRTYNTGAAVDTIAPQSEWNRDKLDGTGESGITLDLDMVQLSTVDYEWLGVGRVRFGFKIGGLVYHVHDFTHTNELAEVYMSNPNAPIRFEIINDGTGAAASLDTICVSVQSEGGHEENALTTYLSRDGSPITLGAQDTYTPILSVRLKPTRPCTRTQVKDVSILATSNINFEWALFLNPTVAGVDGASWVDRDDSALQYDLSRDNTNILTGGYVVDGGYGSSTNQTRVPVGEVVESFLTIGTAIDGTPDEYVLGVKNIAAAGGIVYGGMTLGEYC